MKTGKKLFYPTVVALLIAGAAIMAAKNRRPVETSAATDKEDALSAATMSLPASVENYLQNSLLYGNYYNENQYFVVWRQEIENRLPEFSAAMEKLARNYSNYVFLPRFGQNELLSPAEEAADREFLSLCGSFCIVNPDRREIFYINRLGRQDIFELPHIFAALSAW